MRRETDDLIDLTRSVDPNDPPGRDPVPSDLELPSLPGASAKRKGGLIGQNYKRRKAKPDDGGDVSE